MVPLWLLLALFAKHWLCDYPLQFAYMLEGKGKLFDRGAMHHAMFHCMGTMLVFNIFGCGKLGFLLSGMDFVIHYACDFAKSKINNIFSLNPSDKWFWNLLGLDQFAHHATYVLLVCLAVS